MTESLRYQLPCGPGLNLSGAVMVKEFSNCLSCHSISFVIISNIFVSHHCSITAACCSDSRFTITSINKSINQSLIYLILQQNCWIIHMIDNLE